MFDVDPETLKSGKEHTIMPWLRSWRPTYIYVRWISIHIGLDLGIGTDFGIITERTVSFS